MDTSISLGELHEEKLADCEAIRRRLVEIRRGIAVAGEAPKVSVIIPAYESAAFIGETLASVFAQTRRDYEVIVINDGSSDTEKLEAVLAPYFDQIIYARQENLGASQARNSAICLARGELVAFLDADDIWQPDFLQSQIDFLEKYGFDMVYCDALLFGAALFEGKTYAKDAPSRGAVTPESLINCECNVITSGTILKKAWLARVALFDTGLKFMQDFDLWFRLAKHGAKIGYQTAALVKYRIRPNSLSGGNVQRAWRNIRGMNVINHKYELSPAEKSAWEKQYRLFEAEYELEKGKFSLTQDEFAVARQHFVRANAFYRKPKLTLLIWLMRFSPGLSRQLFKKFRRAEFSFIAPEKN